MSRNRLRTYLIALAIVVNVINLLPVIQSPFLGDDAWRESCISGVALLTNTSLGEISWSVTKDFIRDGRWYPLVIYYYAAFYYLDRAYYKAAEIVLIIVNIVLFGYLVQLVTGRKVFFLITLLVAPLFFQFRFYHDPILSYYYLMQLEFLFLVSSLIFFILFIRNFRRLNLVLSIVFFAIALLIYEAFYSFCAMYPLVAYTQLGASRKKLIIWLSAPFFLLVLANVGITLFIRTHFHTSYEGTTLSLQFGPWFMAFLKQVFAAVPLSYFFSSGWHDQILDYVLVHFLNQIVVILALWTVLWLFVWDYAVRRESYVSRKDAISLGIMGLGFWILPAVIVTLSAKYQRELKWGLGYLPVYVSGFGLMMILLMALVFMDSALKKMTRFFRRSLVIASAVVGGTLIGVNFISNNIVVQGYNDAEHYHRSLMEQALDAGLMKGVEDASFIVFGNPVRSWDEAAFYRMHSGLTLQVVKPPGFEMDSLSGVLSYKNAFQDYLSQSGPPDVFDFSRLTIPKTKFSGYSAKFEGTQGVVVRRNLESNTTVSRPNVFFVKYEAETKDMGYALLAHLTKLQALNDAQIISVADSMRIYIAIPVGKVYKEIIISGNWIDPVSMKTNGAFLFKDRELSLLASQAKGKIFELPVALTGKGIDPASVVATLTMTEN
ncbi:MAG: hypothetical protein V1897_18780 [Pseudomonadota bacterium]